MIKSKLLNDSAWKDVLSKNKGLKDNGLLKSLGELKKLDDDDHAEAQKCLDQVLKLAGQLKKAKEVAAVKDVSKFMDELIDAAETAQRDVAKAKAEADKQGKLAAAAEAKKAAQEDKKGADDEEDEQESELLTTKMIPLLRAAKSGDRMEALVASSGKRAVVLLSRKPISPSRRKILAEALGGTGGIKYFPGHCTSERGALTFVLATQVAGMAKKLKLALLEQTGMRINTVNCRGEDGETDADEE
jgi:hypothetical protein